MKLIGITGGIGSGKSLVGKVFSILGVPVFNSDTIASQLIHHNPWLINEITRLFGNDAYINGLLNKKLISQQIFSKPEMLKQMNELVHPMVFAAFFEWKEKNKSAPYLIKEAAILFESGSYKDCSFIITVTAEESLRINRVKKRDGLTEEEIRKRIKNQWPEEKKIQLSQAVIYNNNTDLILPQIIALHEAFIRPTNN